MTGRHCERVSTVLDDTWGSRDLPVLEAAVLGVDRNPFGGIKATDIAAATGLSIDEVVRALKAIESGHLVDVAWTMPAMGARVRKVSGEARQIVGAWPSADSATDRLLALIEQQIEATTDDAKRSQLEAFREGAAGVGRDVLVSLLSKMLLGQ